MASAPAVAQNAGAVDRFFEYSVLALVACGHAALAVTGYLDWVSLLVAPAAIAVRALRTAGYIRYTVSNTALLLTIAAASAIYAVDLAYISRMFLPAALHAGTLLGAALILCAATDRHLWLLRALAYAELLAAGVLGQNLALFFLIGVFLLLSVATFTSAEVRRSARRARWRRVGNGFGVAGRLATASAGISALILLLTAALFFVLPRTARAAFQHFSSGHRRLTGFSPQIDLGRTGELLQDNTPVMHVRIDDPNAAGMLLKWRGSALMDFDGHRWFNAPSSEETLYPDARGDLRLGEVRGHEGRHVSYSVHLHDNISNTLFFAGVPEYLHIDAPMIMRTAANGYRIFFPGNGGVSYQVFGFLENGPAGDGDLLDPATRERCLRLPALDPRIKALALRLTAAAPGRPYIQALSIERYLRTRFSYTLQLPSHEPADPVADFLFRRKRGHCEYFASAMTVLLRDAGIPARVATGFGDGIYNPISGWQVLRASDAHSWVEAYIPERGWISFDPTPPETSASAQSGAWFRVGLYLDAAQTYWQDWVLDYNLDRQLTLAARVGESGRSFRVSWFDDAGAEVLSWGARITAMAKRFAPPVLLGIAILLIARELWRWILRLLRHRRRLAEARLGKATASDATLLYDAYLRVLKRRGFEKPAWLTPNEFAAVIAEPRLAAMAQDFTDAYNEVRFGARPDAAARMVRAMELLAQR